MSTVKHSRGARLGGSTFASGKQNIEPRSFHHIQAARLGVASLAAAQTPKTVVDRVRSEMQRREAGWQVKLARVEAAEFVLVCSNKAEQISVLYD